MTGPTFGEPFGEDGLPTVMFWATDNHSGEVQKSTFDPDTGEWNWDELESLPEGTPKSVFESSDFQ